MVTRPSLHGSCSWRLPGFSLGPFLVTISSGQQGKSQERSVGFAGDTKAVDLGLVHLEQQGTQQHLSAGGERINETGASSLQQFLAA